MKFIYFIFWTAKLNAQSIKTINLSVFFFYWVLSGPNSFKEHNFTCQIIQQVSVNSYLLATFPVESGIIFFSSSIKVSHPYLSFPFSIISKNAS